LAGGSPGWWAVQRVYSNSQEGSGTSGGDSDAKAAKKEGGGGGCGILVGVIPHAKM